MGIGFKNTQDAILESASKGSKLSSHVSLAVDTIDRWPDAREFQSPRLSSGQGIRRMPARHIGGWIVTRITGCFFIENPKT